MFSLIQQTQGFTDRLQLGKGGEVRKGSYVLPFTRNLYSINRAVSIAVHNVLLPSVLYVSLQLGFESVVCCTVLIVQPFPDRTNAHIFGADLPYFVKLLRDATPSNHIAWLNISFSTPSPR